MSFVFFLYFIFYLLFFLGGFKGQVRWPEGPPHLALNPPYLFFSLFLFCFFGFVLCFFVSSFLSLLLIEKLVFPPKRAFFVYCWVSPFVSPWPFWPPTFSISLSLSLSLYLSCSVPLVLVFLSSFLSFLFALFWFLVFVSFFPLLSSLLLLHEKNNIKLFYYKVFLHQSFLFFWFPVLFIFEIPFCYLYFSCFKLCFCWTWMFLSFKKAS